MGFLSTRQRMNVSKNCVRRTFTCSFLRMFTDEQAEEAWGNLADRRQAVPLIQYWTAKVLGHAVSPSIFTADNFNMAPASTPTSSNNSDDYDGSVEEACSRLSRLFHVDETEKLDAKHNDIVLIALAHDAQHLLRDNDVRAVLREVLAGPIKCATSAMTHLLC